MSKEATENAVEEILKKVNAVFKQYTRGDLDKNLHVIDISYKSILKSFGIKRSPRFKENYLDFLRAAVSKATKVPDYLAALQHTGNNKGTSVIINGSKVLLINKNFDTARSFITQVSKLIPKNRFFGRRFRSRDLREIKSSYYTAKDSMFLTKVDNKYIIEKIEKIEDRYLLIPVQGFDDIKSVYYLKNVNSKSYTKRNKLENFVGKEVEISTEGNVIIKKEVLAILDLGHGQGAGVAQVTPLGQKFTNLLNIEGLSNEAQELINQHIRELEKIHNVVTFEFKNNSDNTQASGYIVLSVQPHDRNNYLAIREAELARELKNNLVKFGARILLEVPGSNSIVEDRAEALENLFTSILTNKPIKKIKAHHPVKGKTNVKLKVAKPSTVPVAYKREEKILPNAQPKYSNIQVTNLVTLQRLLDASLHEQIRRNMGTGNRRDVLNYRSGRFAESVKVERLSESRQEMITAFYSYMKNPYATFSAGGRQELPRSRDPKTIISRSIREVAQTLVTNRLRAVNV